MEEKKMALAAQLPEVPRTQAPRYPEQNQSKYHG